MAQAVETTGTGPLHGLVVTRYGYAVPCQRIEIVEASHPVPDAAGRAAAERMLALVRACSADDLVLCLISGGGSSLLPLAGAGPDAGRQAGAQPRAAEASGATIGEMNCVRRHLSAIKGGRLAAACHPARVLTLLISDVPGDDPIDIASGPTVADPTHLRRRAGHRAALRHRAAPGGARACLHERRRRDRQARRPAPAARRDAHHRHAAEGAGSGRGRWRARPAAPPTSWATRIEGEARDVGKVLAGIALQVAERGQPVHARPACCCPAARPRSPCAATGAAGAMWNACCRWASTLNGHPRIHALAGDTDGVDGQEEIAGALLAPDSLARAWALGLQARRTRLPTTTVTASSARSATR